MLQRIQTVYLLLTVVFIALSMTLSLTFYSNLIQNAQFNYSILSFLHPTTDFEKNFNSLPLFAFSSLSVILALITIFLFKKRNFQYRICVINTIVILFYIGMLGYYFYTVFDMGSNDVKLNLKVPLVFPAIALIFNFLAMRGIKKDENLIKSLDRLR